MAQAHAHEHLSHGHAHAQAHPAVKWFGIAGGIATAICMTLILEKVFLFSRVASGILIGVIGIPIGAFSNANSANPNGQSYMEWFGYTMFLCSLMRFLHVTDILAVMAADSPFMTSIINILRMFM